VEADGFDFFGVTDRRGSNLPGVSILENAETNGDAVALLFVALEAEVGFVLAEAFPGNLKAFVVLLAFKEFGGGIGAFGDICGSGILVLFIQEFEELAGSDGSNSAREVAAGGIGEAGGIFAAVFHGGDVFLFIEPAPVTDFAPVTKVSDVDGNASELGGEDFFDNGELIEPSENVLALVAVVKAEVDFLANIGGKPSDFAIGGTAMALWLRPVLNIFFVIHPAILAQEEKGHSSSLPLFFRPLKGKKCRKI
jgi:hypothetical protein